MRCYVEREREREHKKLLDVFEMETRDGSFSDSFLNKQGKKIYGKQKAA